LSKGHELYWLIVGSRNPLGEEEREVEEKESQNRGDNVRAVVKTTEEEVTSRKVEGGEEGQRREEKWSMERMKKDVHGNTKKARGGGKVRCDRRTLVTGLGGIFSLSPGGNRSLGLAKVWKVDKRNQPFTQHGTGRRLTRSWETQSKKKRGKRREIKEKQKQCQSPVNS